MPIGLILMLFWLRIHQKDDHKVCRHHATVCCFRIISLKGQRYLVFQSSTMLVVYFNKASSCEWMGVWNHETRNCLISLNCRRLCSPVIAVLIVHSASYSFFTLSRKVFEKSCTNEGVCVEKVTEYQCEKKVRNNHGEEFCAHYVPVKTQPQKSPAAAPKAKEAPKRQAWALQATSWI